MRGMAGERGTPGAVQQEEAVEERHSSADPPGDWRSACWSDSHRDFNLTLPGLSFCLGGVRQPAVSKHPPPRLCVRNPFRFACKRRQRTLAKVTRVRKSLEPGSPHPLRVSPSPPGCIQGHPCAAGVPPLRPVCPCSNSHVTARDGQRLLP